MKKILLCRTDAIGDLILTLPVARSIAERHPQLHLSLLVSEYTKPLLENESYLDDILTIKGRSPAGFGAIKELAQLLGEHRFDTIIHIYPRFGLALAAAFAGIDRRVGTAYRGYSFLFNHQVKLHRRKSSKHELDLNYDLVESLFPDLKRHRPALTVSDRQINAARRLLEKRSDRPHYVVIHPLSQGSAPNWRLSRYLDLADKIAASDHQVVITGSAVQRSMIAAALASRRRSHLNLAGETDLTTLVGVIRNAKMIVTGSTGPIHIAAAVGTFAVGIYPPQTALSATRWGPGGRLVKLFVPRIDGKASAAVACMDAVATETVAAFILSKLEEDAKLLI